MIVLKKSRILLVLFFTLAALVFITTDGKAVSETSRTNHTLTKGVTETEVYVTDSHNENVRMHIMRINKGANVSLKVSTANYYKKNSNKAARTSAWKNNNKSIWGYKNVAKQAKAYEKTSDKKGKVIGGINGDFYMLDRALNGMTVGNLVMEGNAVRKSDAEPFFAVLKDGSYVIRGAGESVEDVQEAVSGHRFILKDGKPVHSDDGSVYPFLSLGVTKDGTVVLACLPARGMLSKGTTLHNFEKALQQQGCVDAIMLDGGGSASFLSKRKGDKSLVYRNEPFGGMPRGVSSALLIVKNKKAGGGKITGQSSVSMKSKKTKLKKAKNGLYSYKANGKVRKGFVNVNGIPFMFNKKGKGMSKKFVLGENNYTYKKGVAVKIGKKKVGKVKAGKLAIGFCGSKGKDNLLFAYQFGKKQLDIGLNPLAKKKNGKMQDWKGPAEPPWMTEQYNIKKIVVGKGVKNIGSTFLVISTKPFDVDSKGVKTSLKTIVLPKSLKTIGARAFFNHFRLKNVNIPAKVKKIGAKAFYFNNGTTFTFEGKKPPKIAKGAFTKNKKSKKPTIFKVKKTKQWKKFLTKKNKKKIGFSGKVKYVK